MKYEVIHVLERREYIKQLEALAAKGFHVISAGMTPNPAVKCFEWWAVLEETPVDVVLKKPEGNAAGLLEAARKIAKECARHGERCTGCELFRADGCAARPMYGDETYPEKWRILRQKMEE